MALAGAGQKYLWTKDTGPPPPPSGLALQYQDTVSFGWIAFLLGATIKWLVLK